MRLLYSVLCALLLLLGCVPQPVRADACQLHPLEESLQIPALSDDEPSQAVRGYRRELLYFVNAFYGVIAQDILRGSGEYLNTLQRMMGSSGDSCLATYKQLLVQERTSQDFGLALWAWRVVDRPDGVRAAVDWGSISVQ